MRKAYLGDSVYVTVEGGMLRLTTENGDGASNVIFLEPSVYSALVDFAKTLKADPMWGWLE